MKDNYLLEESILMTKLTLKIFVSDNNDDDD